MRLYILKILIVCVAAISFHGFSPDEHLVPTVDQGGESQSYMRISDIAIHDSTPSFEASCDICQVVHQYILADNLVISARSILTTRTSREIGAPPDRFGNDILRPPTV